MSLEGTRKRKRTNLFVNDIKPLLYAFGDVSEPYPETVAALEDILTDYIVDTCHEAAKMAEIAGRQKIKVDDFKFLLRNDPRKLGRAEELLVLQKEFVEARKAFDSTEGKQLSKTYNQEKEKEKKKKEKEEKKEKKRKEKEEKKKEKEAKVEDTT
ncbi:Transcription initiation factor TFIID subunit 13 [Yarrowia sp. B02]|nr:Transcription initiation factor TFIID subunit 13 [Yarrowia sp. B02]